MHPITRARAFRPFALNAVFRFVTIISLANVSSRILECLSVCESKEGYSSSATAPPSLAASYPAAAYVSSQSLRAASFCQRDEAAHSRERSFQRRSSMRHVTIILNNLPTEEYKVDSYVNAYPLFSRPIPPLAIRDSSDIVFFRSARLRSLTSFSLFLFSFSLAFYFSSQVSFLLVLIFRRFIFTRFSFVSSMVTSCLRFMFIFIIALLRALSFSLFTFLFLSFVEGFFFFFHRHDLFS